MLSKTNVTFMIETVDLELAKWKETFEEKHFYYFLPSPEMLVATAVMFPYFWMIDAISPSEGLYFSSE